MAYDKLKSYMTITDDPAEMIGIAHRIADDYPNIYTPLMMEKMYEGVESHIPDASAEKKQEMLYRAIYDFWAYGCNVDEEFYLHFDTKTDAEKKEYLVNRLRHIYVHHLNVPDGADLNDRVYALEDKYRLYQRLKPYYLRDMIEVEGEADFSTFESFTHKHTMFVVKPSDYFYGIGVHKASLKDYGGDARAAFNAILAEGIAIRERHPSRKSKMVLEELIDQEETMASLHPESVNALRITTVRAADGDIVMYRPRIKIGMNGNFLASAAQNGVVAEIDPVTGVIRSDGYNENGEHYLAHPNSGIPIKGFQIPKWDKLLNLVDDLNHEMNEFGYIGWDLVLSKCGWCVMEGNYSGEIASQVILGRGLRRELEELIGWKFERDYWWQDPRGEYKRDGT